MKKIAFIVVLMVSSFLFASFLVTEGDKETKKVFLINVAGMDRYAVENFSEDLPNTREIKENGVYGTTKSSQKITISPIETIVLASGKDPQNYTLIDYGEEEREYMHSSGRPITSKDIKVERIWNIADKRGLKVGVYNWLLTWPPEKVDGFMISGRMGKEQNKRDLTYPDNLKNDLEELTAQINPSNFKKILNEYKDVNLWSIQFESVHESSHRYWGSLYPEKYNLSREKAQKYRKKLKKSYKKIDRMIGYIREKYPDSNIIITGDIGFKKTDSWHGLTYGLFRELGIGLKVYNWDLEFPPGFNKEKAEKEGMLGSIGPWVRVKKPKNHTERDIVNKLKSIKVKSSNERFIRNITFKDGQLWFRFNFKRNYVSGITDELELQLGENKNYSLPVKRMTGGHGRKSAFIASGPDIKEMDMEINLDNAEVAPTVLSMLDIEVPDSLKNNVREEILVK